MHRSTRSAGLVAAAFVSIIVSVPTPEAAADAADICRSKQIAAAGKACSLVLKKCYAGVAKTGMPYDRICVSDARLVFATAMDAAEVSGMCDQSSLDVPVWARLTGFAEEVATDHLLYQGGGLCAAKKLKSVAKTCQSLAKCYSIAAKKGEDVDSTCLTDATGKHTETFVKIDSTGACDVTGNAATVQPLIEEAVLDLTNLYTVGTTTTTTLEPLD